jgi:hypothetical protein
LDILSFMKFKMNIHSAHAFLYAHLDLFSYV